jgi:hypothetical protein
MIRAAKRVRVFKLAGRRESAAPDVSREQVSPVEGLAAMSLGCADVGCLRAGGDHRGAGGGGRRGLHLVLPITIAIVALLAILVFSYLQVSWLPRHSWSRSPVLAPSKLVEARC